MTRKDYEKVAQALREYHLDIHNEFKDGGQVNSRLDILEGVADILADIFQEDNPRFLKGRFLSACVPNELVGGN